MNNILPFIVLAVAIHVAVFSIPISIPKEQPTKKLHITISPLLALEPTWDQREMLDQQQVDMDEPPILFRACDVTPKE